MEMEMSEMTPEKGMTEKVLGEAMKLLLLGTSIYGSLDCALPKEVVSEMKESAGGRFIYLTSLSLYLTITSAILGYLTRILGYLTNLKSVKMLALVYRELLALSFSLEGIVTMMFWTLYSINPGFVRSKKLHSQGIRISLLTELSQHLFPLLLLLVCQAQTVIKKTRRCLYFLFAFGTGYFLNIWFFSTINGRWPYPFMNKISMPLRILVIAMGCLVGTVFCYVLLAINRLIHQKRIKKVFYISMASIIGGMLFICIPQVNNRIHLSGS